MKYADILEKIDTEENTKRLHRIYFYSQLNNYPQEFLQGLFDRIQKRSGLNREQMLEAQAYCAFKWDSSIAQTDEMLSHMNLARFIAPVLSKNASSFSSSELISLFRTLLVCTLQKASLISFKNQMKADRVEDFLSFALADRSKGITKAIQNLLLLVASQKSTPTQRLYVSQSEALINLIALDYMDHLNGRSRISRKTYQNFADLDKMETEALIASISLPYLEKPKAKLVLE